MRLSKNFVLSEIIRSNTAKRLGIDNEPKKEHLKNLQRIITSIIQRCFLSLFDDYLECL